jgi:hypothetical protein
MSSDLLSFGIAVLAAVAGAVFAAYQRGKAVGYNEGSAYVMSLIESSPSIKAAFRKARAGYFPETESHNGK